MLTKKDTAILFCCHYLNKKILREFRKVRSSCRGDFDAILVCTSAGQGLEKASPYPHHIFDLGRIEKLGYKLHDGHLWCNPDYMVLDFFHEHPDYKHYWRIEYDVGFAGSWKKFFSSFVNDGSDLLGTNIARYDERPGWDWWGSINFPADKDKLMSMLFPLERFSNRALRALDSKYRAGACGYCEVVVPTLLKMENLSIGDIGKKFYDADTFHFKNYRMWKPGKLLHKVDRRSLTECCKEMLDKIVNAGKRYLRPDRMKLYSFYSDETKSLKEIFLKTLKDDWDLNIKYLPKNQDHRGDFGTPAYTAVLRQKVEYIITAIENNLGHTIIWSDIDIQFFGKCSGLIKNALKNNDILFQAEWYPYRKEVNAGFMVIKCTGKTLAFFKNIQAIEFERLPFRDQTAINDFLKDHKGCVEWDILPGQFWASSHSQPPPPDIVLHHANKTSPAEKDGRQIGSVELKLLQVYSIRRLAATRRRLRFLYLARNWAIKSMSAAKEEILFRCNKIFEEARRIFLAAAKRIALNFSPITVEIGSFNTINIELYERASSYFITFFTKIKRGRSIKRTVRIGGPGGQLYSRIRMQTPGRNGVWGNTLFTYHGPADIYVDINMYGLSPRQWPAEKRWLIVQEPPPYVAFQKVDDPKRLAQYSRIYTCDPSLHRPNDKFILGPVPHDWFLEKDYDFLKSRKETIKYTNLSCITTKALLIGGHTDRIEFTKKLCESGLDFDLYAPDNWKRYPQYKGWLSPTFFEPWKTIAYPELKNSRNKRLPSKWDVFSRSRFSLIMENYSGPYYFSEKLLDAILSFSIPIYYGCTDLGSYFPEGSYIPIDIHDPKAIGRIGEILKSSYYKDNVDKLLEARSLVLEKYNICAFLDREITNAK